MPELVLATQNSGKVDELARVIAGAGLDGSWSVRALSDLPGHPFAEPDETGQTFEANATIKALAYARATGMWCLADDSGLVVDTMSGDGVERPGVVSSHFAWVQAGGLRTPARRDDPGAMDRAGRDAANNARLLDELAGVTPEHRAARFVCTMVLCAPPSSTSPRHPGAEGVGPHASGAEGASKPRVVAVTRGSFPGRIGLPPGVPRGAGGFGYDPLFLVGPGFERTSAELAKHEKDAVSHRGQALRAIIEVLRSLA
jgi:XTP/dITP diphosphohydrolase